MDNQALTASLADPRHRQFWIVLWGDPTHSPDEDAQAFDEPFYDHGFPRDVPDMKIGDILFVHRIKISKIIFVGEVVDESRKSRPDEIERDDWRKHWAWSVRLQNLTPTYGRHWKRRAQKTFALKDEYNDRNPQNLVSIGALQHGSHVRIPEGFARFLLNEIIRLD
jgi:hypothetical protein